MELLQSSAPVLFRWVKSTLVPTVVCHLAPPSRATIGGALFFARNSGECQKFPGSNLLGLNPLDNSRSLILTLTSPFAQIQPSSATTHIQPLRDSSSTNTSQSPRWIPLSSPSSLSRSPVSLAELVRKPATKKFEDGRRKTKSRKTRRQSLMMSV